MNKPVDGHTRSDLGYISLNSSKTAVQAGKSLWRRCRQRMTANNAMAISASLSYRTVFAIIPVLVLAFLILKASGVVENGKKSLHQVLEAAGMAQISAKAENMPQGQPSGDGDGAAPDMANLAEKIESAVGGVESKMTFARLGPIGLILMAWSAITLLTTVERALNKIFEAPASRPLMIRVLLYWSTVTFLPLVLVAVGYIGAKSMQMVGQHMPLAGLVVLLDVLANLVAGVLVLACVYKFLPNTRVPLRAAIVGAAAVVPLWIIARWAFAIYVERSVAKGSVYGTLGLLPLFLIWVNLCWYAFLMGAEVAYAWANRHRVEGDPSGHLLIGPLDVLRAALAVGEAYAVQKRPAGYREVLGRVALPEPAARWLLDRLAKSGIICRVAQDDREEAYVPARPLDSIRAHEVLQLGQSGTANAPSDRELDLALEKVNQLTLGALGGVSLLQLLQKEPSAGVPAAQAQGAV